MPAERSHGCGTKPALAVAGAEPLGPEGAAAIDDVVASYVGQGSSIADSISQLLQEEDEVIVIIIDLEKLGAEEAELMLALLERLDGIRVVRGAQERTQQELERVGEAAKAGEVPPADALEYLNEQGMGQAVDDIAAVYGDFVGAAGSAGSAGSDTQQGSEDEAAALSDMACAMSGHVA